MLKNHKEEDNLYLSFVKNGSKTKQVTGRGWNRFGSFTLDGQYDKDGNVILRKHYEEHNTTTALGSMTLKDLQALAARLHVPAPSRLKKLKKTWMQAINEHWARTTLPLNIGEDPTSESLDNTSKSPDAASKASNFVSASLSACVSLANESVARSSDSSPCPTSTKMEEDTTPKTVFHQQCTAAISLGTEPTAKAATPPSTHEVASRTDPKLLEFQKNARLRLLRCALEQQGALLKGAVGSGKTVTMLSVALELLLRDEEAIAHRPPGVPEEMSEGSPTRPILIISPVAVMHHWYTELDLAVSVVINSISQPSETGMATDASEAQQLAMARATRLKNSLKKSAKLFHGAAREDCCDPSTDRLWITSAETVLSEHKRFGKASDVREFCLRGAVVIMDEVHIYRSGSKELVAQDTVEAALVKPLKRYQAATALVVQPVLEGLSEEKEDSTADLGDVATRRELGAHGVLLAATATPMVNSALDLLGLAHWFSLSRVCPKWKKRRLRAAQVGQGRTHSGTCMLLSIIFVANMLLPSQDTTCACVGQMPPHPSL